jgi:hydrogenase/urease accessory protein HupE
MRRLVLLLACLASMASPARAHEVRPAYLELRQTGPGTYGVLWKIPAIGDQMSLGIAVALPAGCSRLSEPQPVWLNGARIERWTVRCPGGLTDSTVSVAGLAATAIDVLVRIERLDGVTQTVRLLPSRTSFVVEATPGRMEVVRTYLPMGVEHILGGFDHLLFVLALLIITQGTWRLVKTVTAFTVAHSITLTAAALGFVHVPQRPVEAVIALSIVFVAAEIIHARRGVPGLAVRAPWIVAFTFGLMHGLGFAGALSEAGLPAAHVPTALLCFSVGVEIGHILFIAAALSVMALVRRSRFALPRWAELVPTYAVGGVAMFWVIQRLSAI